MLEAWIPPLRQTAAAARSTVGTANKALLASPTGLSPVTIAKRTRVDTEARRAV